MTSFLNHCRTHWVALALLACLSLTPTTARASCGDYASVRAPGALPPGVTAPHSQPTQPPSPCHGPNCSRAPKSPLVPASSSLPSSNDDWGYAEGAVAFTVNGTSTTLQSSASTKESHSPSDIFHPPR